MGKYAKKSRLSFAWIFGLLLACNILAVGVTLAGFVTSTEDGAVSGAASFNVSAGTTNTSTILFSDMFPGDSKNWNFSITNDSEVSVRIVMKVESTKNLPLNYSVGGTSLPIGKATQIYVFAPGSSNTVDFSLTASWPQSQNNVKYLYEADAVTITITAEQVD